VSTRTKQLPDVFSSSYFQCLGLLAGMSSSWCHGTQKKRNVLEKAVSTKEKLVRKQIFRNLQGHPEFLLNPKVSCVLEILVR
jgi:hypothetical protein